jgi:hypothetical protein
VAGWLAIPTLKPLMPPLPTECPTLP